MAHGTGLRFFLFEADGALRRLPMRTVDGMIRGEDRMTQYAGQRLRAAMAWLLLDDGMPTQLLKVEGSWWRFDARGRTVEGHMEAMREALNAIYAADGTGERDPDGFRRQLARRRLEREWRWTPTPVEITAIVHAIWPETAGRPVQLPTFARGQARRRYPVSSKAKYARQQCAEQVWKLAHAIDDLGEHDLKGLISALGEDAHASGEGTEHLWQGVKAFAEWQLARRKARRSRRGTWYAWVEAATRDADSYTSWTCDILEHRRCTSRDAAVLASRELLSKHAGRFDHDIRIEANICPEIEWPAYSERDPTAGDDEDEDSEPRSPLVHPALVAADFANDE